MNPYPSKHRLQQAIASVVADEQGYAERLREQGDFSRAKYIWAALQEVRDALQSIEQVEETRYASSLKAALVLARSEYSYNWNDEDGIGSSTFSRLLSLLE